MKRIFGYATPSGGGSGNGNTNFLLSPSIGYKWQILWAWAYVNANSTVSTRTLTMGINAAMENGSYQLNSGTFLFLTATASQSADASLIGATAVQNAGSYSNSVLSAPIYVAAWDRLQIQLSGFESTDQLNYQIVIDEVLA